ncbi:MAG: glycosyltransferase family 2 protein [Candidatus Saccharimonadales bacterium]
MKNVAISIIIPAYNAEKTIGRIIEKTLNQPYRNIELIVVNDGSKDRTEEVVGGYMGDKRLIAISQANRGASAARNAGIRMATGKYIMFFDADDDVVSTMIEKMFDAAEKNGECLVVCATKFGEKRVLAPEKGGIVRESIKKHVVGSILKDGLLYSPCNKIYRNDVVKKNQIVFDEKIKYGEDLIFNLAYFAQMKSIYYIKEPLYIYEYSKNGSSATTAASGAYRKAMYKALVGYVGGEGNKIQLALIRLRWRLSVLKAKVRGGRKNG